MSSIASTAQERPNTGLVTLTIAPVGHQAAAVAAPLLTILEQDAARSQILLVATEETMGVAYSIHTLLTDRLRSVEDSTLPAPLRAQSDDDLGASLLKEIGAQAAAASKITYLMNGGPAAWLIQILRLLEERSGVTHCVSRDHLLMTVPPAEVGVKIKSRRIDSIEDDLLWLLRLKHDPAAHLLTGRHGGAIVRLDGVIELIEHAGQLFAAIGDWNVSGPRALRPTELYRRRLLDWRRLQRLGLEPRRVFISLSGAGLSPQQRRELAARAREDGIPVESHSTSLAAWKKLVRADKAIGLPEPRLTAHRGLAEDTKGAGGWSGPTLVTAMGTQPGSTLQAIFDTTPSSLVLVVDPDQPLSTENAHRLREMAGEFAFGTIRFVTRPAGIAPVQMQNLDRAAGTGRIEVNLSPGDKLFKFLLATWSLADPERRQLTTLDRQRPAFIPLEIWLRMHAPLNRIDWKPAEMLRSFTAMALNGCQWIVEKSRTNNLSALKMLDRLWERNRPPMLELGNGRSGILTWIDDSTHDIGGSRGYDDLGKAVWNSMGPVRAHRGEQRGNGEWFEWVLGATLLHHGLDEVFWDVQTQDGSGRRRDQLDLVSRAGKTTCHWSIKTSSSMKLDDLVSHLQEARAQADRILGRQQHAVLVTPRLKLRATRLRDEGFDIYRFRIEGQERFYAVMPELGVLADAAAVLAPDVAVGIARGRYVGDRTPAVI